MARNVIERILGVLKKRFPILDLGSDYPFDTQIDLVLALAALHNFIRQNSPESEFTEWENTDDDREDSMHEDDGNQNIYYGPEEHAAVRFRNEIAEQMWIGYVHYRRT
jgi:hypothetical protein